MELRTSQLRVEPWPDPVIDRLGFGPRSPYAETGGEERFDMGEFLMEDLSRDQFHPLSTGSPLEKRRHEFLRQGHLPASR